MNSSDNRSGKPEGLEGLKKFYELPKATSRPNGVQLAKSAALMGLFFSILFSIVSLGFRVGPEVIPIFAIVGLFAGLTFGVITDFLKMGLFWYYVIGGLIFFPFVVLANYVVKAVFELPAF